MNKLEKYIKSQLETTRKVVTSINLEKEQLEFLKRKNLNLSMLVRDMIANLMETFPENEKIDL